MGYQDKAGLSHAALKTQRGCLICQQVAVPGRRLSGEKRAKCRQHLVSVFRRPGRNPKPVLITLLFPGFHDDAAIKQPLSNQTGRPPAIDKEKIAARGQDPQPQ